MAVQRGLGDDHEVLSKNAFCSGYVDSFGKWNNGFACPSLEEESVFCCGTSTYRYCCTTREQRGSGGSSSISGGSEYSDYSEPDLDGRTNAGQDVADNLPLLISVALGAVATVLLLAVIACCCCRASRRCRKGSRHKQDTNQSRSSTGVNNMYSYSTASLGRRDVRQDVDVDVLQDVDEVAVRRPSRLNNATAVSTLPRTFSSYRANRVSFSDSVGNSSVSTTTDNERQLFIEQSLPPPPYNFNKLNTNFSSGTNFNRSLEEQLPAPYPPSFCSGDFDSGHYLAGMSPNDDSFYRDNKL